MTAVTIIMAVLYVWIATQFTRLRVIGQYWTLVLLTVPVYLATAFGLAVLIVAHPGGLWTLGGATAAVITLSLFPYSVRASADYVLVKEWRRRKERSG